MDTERLDNMPQYHCDESISTHNTKSVTHGSVVAGGDPPQDVHGSEFGWERVTEKVMGMIAWLRLRSVKVPRQTAPAEEERESPSVVPAGKDLRRQQGAMVGNSPR